jgi:hypothetical protein
MKTLHLVSLTAALAVAPAPLIGQQPQPNPRIAAMKSALRRLVVSQERYFVDHGTYTTDVVALGALTRRQPADSLWVQVIFAGGRSWSGRVVHTAQRGTSCAIYVGYASDFPARPVTERDSLAARNEGEPICDPM